MINDSNDHGADKILALLARVCDGNPRTMFVQLLPCPDGTATGLFNSRKPVLQVCWLSFINATRQPHPGSLPNLQKGGQEYKPIFTCHDFMCRPTVGFSIEELHKRSCAWQKYALVNYWISKMDRLSEEFQQSTVHHKTDYTNRALNRINLVCLYSHRCYATDYVIS